MQYSLKILNQKINFSNLNITEFIETLNLIGFEVDDLIYSSNNAKLNEQECFFVLKIPANRQDLLIEKNFLKEFSFLFNGELINYWNILKKKYFDLLLKNYIKHEKYNYVSIIPSSPQILTSIIEFQISETFSSPLWIQKKLTTFGIPPKKDIQDLINLVNLEWGQSFNLISNLDKENNKLFGIKELNENIVFENSDQSFYNLKPGTIVLMDEEKAIISVLGLKRIKKEKEIDSKSTRKYFLQGYLYDIHKNFLNLNYFDNQISNRSLQTQFFENFRYSFQRLLTLLKIIYSIEIHPRIYFSKSHELSLNSNFILKLNLKSLENLLNLRKINSKIFEKIGLKIICKTNSEFYFSIPSFRKDIRREIDLIEEYSRFIGYKNFEQILPYKNHFFNNIQKVDNYQKSKKLIEQFFLFHGFNQVLTNSIDFINIKREELRKGNNAIPIFNPLNNELTALRTTLLGKLIQIVEKNNRTITNRKKIFEIGKTFRIIDNKIIESEKLSFIFPIENLKKKKNSSTLPGSLEWFIAKAFVEQFLYTFGHKNLKIKKIKKSFEFFHPTNTILFLSDNKVIGTFGEINLKLIDNTLSKNSFFLAEFEFQNFNQETKFNSYVNNYQEYSKYPSIKKDLSFLIDKKTNFYQLKEKIYKNCSHLKSCEFFDIYFYNELKSTDLEESKSNSNEKSFQKKKVTVGMRLEFQSNLETLTNEFVDQQLFQIRSLLQNNFYAEF